MKNENLIGKKFTDKKGNSFTIIEYFNNANVTVQFEDGTIVKNRQLGNIKDGNIKNLNTPNVFGVGYFGVGKYSQLLNLRSYQTWNSMLARCYSVREGENNLTYKDCSVDQKWHDFQVFASWYEKNFKPWMDESWHLDKDILIPGNRIYGPDACCFVPQEINKIFIKRNKKKSGLPIGVSKSGNKFLSKISINSKEEYIGTFLTKEEAFESYKIAKKIKIKNLADKWRDRLTLKCYTAMCNYKYSES